MKAPARHWYETGEQYAECLRRDYVPMLNALCAWPSICVR